MDTKFHSTTCHATTIHTSVKITFNLAYGLELMLYTGPTLLAKIFSQTRMFLLVL